MKILYLRYYILLYLLFVLHGFALAIHPITQKLIDDKEIIGTLVSDTYTQVAKSIGELQIVYSDKDNRPMKMFILEVNLNDPDLSLEVITPFNKNEYNKQNILEMAKSADAPNHRVLAAINADFYNMETMVPIGVLHKNNQQIKKEFGARSYSTIGVMTNGDVFIGKTAKYQSISEKLKEATGAGVMLIENSKMISTDNITHEPRTAIGISENDMLYMLVCDGRRPDYSNGMTYYTMGRIFLALGAKNALNLDGGGSSSFVTRNPEIDELEMRNISSDKVPRLVANGWAIVSREMIQNDFSVNWSINAGNGIGSSSPALSHDNKTIYIAAGATKNGDALLQAYNTINGSKSWVEPFNLKKDGASYTANQSKVEAAPMVDNEGNIYVSYGASSSAPAFLYAVKPDGTEKWHAPIANTNGSVVFQSPPALMSDGSIVAGSRGTKGGIRIYDSKSGTETAYHSTGDGWATNSPVFVTQNDIIYNQAQRLGMYAYQADNTQNSIKQIKLYTFGSSDGNSTIGNFSAAIDDKGTIYSAGGKAGEARIYALKDGVTKWETQKLSASIMDGGAVIGNQNTLYVSTDQNCSLIALDCNTGLIKWEYKNDSPLQSSPAVDDKGYIHFGDSNGNYIVLNDTESEYEILHNEKLYRNGCASTSFYSSPLISPDGNIIMAAVMNNQSDNVLFSVTNPQIRGIADSPWAMRGGSPQRTNLQLYKNPTSSIEISDNEVNITTDRNSLNIEVNAPQSICIYNTQGVLINHTILPAGKTQYNLYPGLYIIKIVDKISKIYIH